MAAMRKKLRTAYSLQSTKLLLGSTRQGSSTRRPCVISMFFF